MTLPPGGVQLIPGLCEFQVLSPFCSPGLGFLSSCSLTPGICKLAPV